ncbi:MAG: nucleotide exchange factor GrpE, partial [Candidatus Lokiarchaeota archaeon]
MSEKEIIKSKENQKKDSQINSTETTESVKSPKEQKEEVMEEKKELTEEEKKEIEKKQKIKKLNELSKEDLIERILELEINLDQKEDLLDKKSGKIKELENQVKNWKDKYMRLQAEFENSQKRWEKSRQALRSQTTANVLKSFLPLYDSFKKAISSNDNDDSIRQFYNQFMNILKPFGVEPMDIKENDKFDYSYHEALSTIEREDIPPNTIIDIIQDGVKINNEVLRYAKVITSRKPLPKPELPKEK